MLDTPPFASKTARISLVALLFAGFALNLALAVRRQSQTIDEGFHLYAGYRYWQCHDFGVNPEHPPLVKFVAAAPLWLGNVPAPAGPCGAEPSTKDNGYGSAMHYLYDQKFDAGPVLFRARMAASVFALLLALVCYLCACTFFGKSAGVIALVLLVFEPNILAHGPLITTDIALSAFLLAAVLAFYRYSRQTALWPLLTAGTLAGLALAVKHSGVLIVPILIALTLLDYVLQRLPSRSDQDLRRPHDLLRKIIPLGTIFVLAAVVLWATYGFRYAARPAQQPMTVSLPQFIADVQEQGTHGFILTAVIPQLARGHVLPEAYLYGLVDVFSVTDPGFPPFLLGKLYPYGRWFYFPITFLIKSTLGFLVVLLLALTVVSWHGNNLTREILYLVIPSAIILAVAMRSGLNIGYRHVLPMVPFLCVIAAGAAVLLSRRSRNWKLMVAFLLAAHVASSLHAFPDYLPYSNEAWGGPSKTYRYLTDSNVDWGQALPETRDYVQSNNISDCWIAYDGTVNVSYYNLPCRGMSASAGAPAEVPPLTATGTFILSALTVSGIEWEPGDLNPYKNFQRATPARVIGGAMLVYEGQFDLTGVAAVTHIARAGSLLAGNKPEEALSEAKAATELTPQSVRAHLMRGHALAKAGLQDEASKEFKTALTLAQANADYYPIQIAEARRELKQK